MGEFFATAGAWVAANQTAIATTAAVASTAATVGANRVSTGARQAELEVAAREEAAVARDREVQRKRRSVALLGEHAAQAAAMGVQLSGSVGNLSVQSAKRAAEDSRVDFANTEGRVNALSRSARSVGRINTYKSGASIFRAGERLVDRL